MKPGYLKAIASSLLLVWMMQTATLVRAGAFVPMEDRRSFLDVVRNTKEANSILFEPTELTEAELTFPSEDAQIRDRLKDAFTAMASTLEDGDEACEPRILSRLQVALKNQALPAEPSAVRQSLLLLRKADLIDDVTLMPLLAAHPAWEKLGYREEDWNRNDPEGRPVSVDCPTDQFLKLVSVTRGLHGRKTKRRHYRKRIEAMKAERNDEGEPRYLPVQIAWLSALEKTRYDVSTPFSLPHAIQQMTSTKDTSERARPDEDIPSRVMSKKKKKGKGLSNRLALYKKFNSFQMNILSDRYKKFTERMSAKSAEIHIEYENAEENEVYSLSAQEQYRMAAKMLHKEIEELGLSKNFAGARPTFDDVILAGVETGFIHAKELDAAMAVDDLWNPNVSPWQKAVKIMKRYGSIALVLIPSPMSFWASLVVTLIQTQVTKNSQTAQPDDMGTSIF